ncbi:hypothetical protein E2P71_04500 [Candidatus Bathyarchaeota archaeon]|nr:hypothetical protein E2P71_04500 [Candidatus Bathyarchaeota archaeon]
MNIIIRTSLLYFNTSSLSAEIFAFMFSLSGLAFIITGIGDLIHRAKTMLLASLSIPILIVVLYFTTQPYLLGLLIASLPWIFTCISLLVIRVRYSSSLDLFVVGWAILTFTNIGALFGVVELAYVEMMAIFGKVVILFGVLYPRFTFLADDLRRFLIAGVPQQYSDQPGDKFVLYSSGLGKRSKEVKWIKERIADNSLKDIRTIIISTYDLISPADMMVSTSEDSNMYFVRMIQGGKSAFHDFGERIIIINDDLNDLDILFSDIINFTKERKITAQIILYNLSALIHTHGWKRVYTFLLSKIPLLKESSVYLYSLYYPKTHEIESDIAKFERLADLVTEI